jgi:hypothetical protein
MQKKTIQKAVKSKMEDWLNSITDETLRKDVKDNILVSGGSIASMFLNETVNDFDVYINDRSVLKKLVAYYVKNENVIVLDGSEKPAIVDELERKYEWVADDIEDIHNQYAIAVRNLKPEQIRLFFKTAGGIRLNKDASEDELKKYIPVFLSPNAISLSNQVQIVTRFHGDDEAIHKTFDFIHATNFFTFEKGLVTNLAAVESLITKHLKYQGSQYPLTSIIRMKKFIKRGWNIGAGEMLKIMFQISLLDLTDADVLEEQLIGVDVAYFGKLIEILRGIEDKEKMTSEYLNAIIDKVFDQSDEENTNEQ